MLSLYLSLVETDNDKEKIVYLFENYYSFMCHCVRLVIGNNEYDVEDIVMSSFIKLIDYLDKIDFSDDVRVKSLCGIVAKNKAIDHCKLKGNQNVSVEDSFVEPRDEETDPAELFLRHDIYDCIVSAIGSLDEKYRDICQLKYINGLKEYEIADVLNLNAKTVNTRINRGRKILREMLRKENIHE